MARDKHGMPVPDENIQLPWISDSCRGINGKARYVAVSTLDAFFDRDSRDFAVHAANWIILCREIVRRLAEPQALSLNEMEIIIQDAAKLWAKMQEDAKGGDGEASL